jgi:hypothetical protein
MLRKDLNIKNKVYIIKYKVIHKHKLALYFRIYHTISILMNVYV